MNLNRLLTFIAVSTQFLGCNFESFDLVVLPEVYVVSENTLAKALFKPRIRKDAQRIRNNMKYVDPIKRLDVENYNYEEIFPPNLDEYDHLVRSRLDAAQDGDFNENSGRYNLFDGNKEITELLIKTGLNNNLFRAQSDEYALDTFSGANKIVGGSDVEINLYPYHVAYGPNCGGAIIDRKWILTAGHCGKKPYIRSGSKYLNQGKKTIVKRNFIHPKWQSTSYKKEHPFDYDFQVLELAEPLKFDENTDAIKIAHIEDMVIGKVITVTGWGNTVENGPYSNILRAIRVPIISKDNCQHVPFPYFRGTLTARMFCAGYPEGKKDACQGDSGGPAVAFDRLLGMVSFGYGCATPGSYGVYSKVATVRDWVKEVTGLKLD